MEWDDERPRHQKKRGGRKSFTILVKFTGRSLINLFPSWGEWRVHQRYRTEADRDKALAALQRKARFCEYAKGD